MANSNAGVQQTDDDNWEPTGVRAGAKEPPQDKDPSVSDSELEALRRDIETAKREKAEALIRAERAESTAVQSNNRLRTETDNRFAAEEVAIANGLAASTREAEGLEVALVAAQEAGKFAEAAKLQRQLAGAQVRIENWENKRQSFNGYKESQKSAAQQPVVTDPYASYTPRTAEWIRAHPQYLTDKKYQARAEYAHKLAVADNLAPDTDAYFDFVNREIDGQSSQAPPQDPHRAEPPHQRQTVRTATPPSRGNSSMTNSRSSGGNTTANLSADEAEMAILSNPKLPPAEAYKLYAESKRYLISQGKISAGAAQ